MLWSTLIVFGIRPAVESGPWLIVVDVAFSLVILAVLRQLVQRTPVFLGALLLLVLTAAARVAEGFEALHWLAGTASALSALLVAMVVFFLLNYVVRAPRVSHNTVLAAICVYILLGVLWGFAYLLLYERNPAAFELGAAPGGGRVDSVEVQLRYFSMMTLTTVGYGDIVPRSPEARAFAALEALIAQIYLAAIVARLVGIQVAHATSGQAVAGAPTTDRPPDGPHRN